MGLVDKEMRRKDRLVSENLDIINIINSCKYLRLGLNDDGEVYIIPLHFGVDFIDNLANKAVFYCHGAKEGRKYDIIRNNPSVGFEMDCDVSLVGEGDIPCVYGAEFASVVGIGKASIIEDVEEKMHALKLLMINQTGRDFAFTEEMTKSVNVIKIETEALTAKRKKVM